MGLSCDPLKLLITVPCGLCCSTNHRQDFQLSHFKVVTYNINIQGNGKKKKKDVLKIQVYKNVWLVETKGFQLVCSVC